MYLFGCGGIAVVAMEVIRAQGLAIEGFLDDASTLQEYRGHPVRPASQLDDEAFANIKVLLCIGDNRRRAELARRIRMSPAAVVHPGCTISPSSRIEDGTMIFQGSVVQAETRIGHHVIVNTRACIDHDCIVGNLVHVAPNTTICGGVKIGDGANVGAGSVIIPNLTIGKWSTIGAGTVVLRNVPDHAVVVGNPARIIKYSEPPPESLPQ